MKRRSGPAPWFPVLAALALALPGCAFLTTDIYRPLVVAEFPAEERVATLQAAYFPDAEVEDLRRSLELTRAAWKVWGIQKYQSFYADLDIQRLADALAEYEDNPFAWTQLGAYLALQHRPGAAAEATRRALDILDGMENLSEWGELEELKRVSAINLAIYQNTGGQPRAALQALARLDSPGALTPFHRLAYHWAEAQAHTGLGNVTASRASLGAAEAVAKEGLGSFAGQADYPQYFKPAKRAALFRFLEAANLRMEGRYEEAIDLLDEALRGPRAVSDPDLLDARFLRALVYKEMGNLDRARSELEELLEQVPPRLFRREAIYYHLALVRIEREELGSAEAALGWAVEIVRDDNRKLRRLLAETMESRGEGDQIPDSVETVLAAAANAEGWIFPPAFEALGEAYLNAVARYPAGPGNLHWAAEAERMFQIALGERGFPRGRELRLPESTVAHADALSPEADGSDYLRRPFSDAAPTGDSLTSRGGRTLLPGVASYGRRHRTLARLAGMHWEAGEHEAALARFAEALASTPGDQRNLAILVELGSRASEAEVAQRAYDLALEHVPLQAAPFGVENVLGRQLERSLVDPPGAEGSEELAHLRARLLLLQGELEAAQAAFETARSEYPDALWPVTGLTWIDLNRDRTDPVEAVRRLDRALASEPSSDLAWQRRDAHFLRGELRLRTEDPEGALADFEAAAELEPAWGLAREGARQAEEKLAEAAVVGDD